MGRASSKFKIRSEAFRLYWYFASERLSIFQKRMAAESSPWTADATLSHYKFCNVFRASDRVSQYLIKNVAYHEETATPEDRLFQIIVFRIFSNIKTWASIRLFLERTPIIQDLEDGSLLKAIEFAKQQNGTLYTGAFILCANRAYGHSAKHLNHFQLFKHMFVKESLGSRLLEADSLKDIYHLLHQYPLLGDFMSYQIAIDLNYSSLINFSENDFTQPGPGALRGIRKAFINPGSYSHRDIILWMVENQEEQFKKYGFEFNGLWGRPLHAIDCQGLFCELDKYCRVALPELESNRKRIKAKFSPSKQNLELFFPPKWGINEKIPRSNKSTQSERSGNYELFEEESV